MTAVRFPALHCDHPHCTNSMHRLAAATIPQLRRAARTHGWVFFDRKDWCPDHATQLGVSAVAP